MKIKIKIIKIIFLLVVICGNLTAQEFEPSKFASGEGTSVSPFVITTLEHLEYLADMVNTHSGCSAGKFFKLGANITSYFYGVIGHSATFAFQGTFDGAGYYLGSINPDLWNRTGPNVGLFGRTSGATIINLTIERVFVARYAFNQEPRVGSLIGHAFNTTVDNCIVRGGNLNTSGIAGGLIGYLDGNSTVTNSSYSGTVSGYGESTGGLIGYATGNYTISNCFSTGRITGSQNVGGFIGYERLSFGEINNCYSTCNTLGLSSVGGFIGRSSGLSMLIADCFATGSVTGTQDYVGGFVGYLDNPGTISRCYATGSVMGESYCGGFVGWIFGNDIIISDSYSTGSVVGDEDGQSAGGFVGRNLGAGTFIRCYSSGSVYGGRYVGGFCGSTEGINSNGVFLNCYASGVADGDYYVGGFFGQNVHYAKNCFAVGAVICRDRRFIREGGFASEATYGSFTNCYFDQQTTGLIHGTSNVNTSVEGLHGYTTTQLTQNPLSDFSTDDWIFEQGYYPQLKVFANNPDAATRQRSALSATPLKLANETELSNDVETVFSLTEKTTTGEIIKWTADLNERVTIFNNSVYAESSDAWRSLSLVAGETERIIKFRSTNGINSAEILGIKINGENREIKGNEFIHRIECGLDDEMAFAEIIIGPYSSSDPGSPVILYANKPQAITVTTDDGNKTKTYTFLAEKLIPSDIFIQRWSDVLAINNNFTTNGGYIFTEYEWYRNGNKLPVTQGYIQTGENSKAIFTVVLTTHEGNKIGTCPAIINSSNLFSLTAWPNPVQSGQSIYVETGIGRVPETYAPIGAIMQLFNSAGYLIAKQILQEPVVEIKAPDIPGQYILQITEYETSKTFKIVVE